MNVLNCMGFTAVTWAVVRGNMQMLRVSSCEEYFCI